MQVKVTLTDLWGSADGGWGENGYWKEERTITLPDDVSDLAAGRAILAAVGAQGFRLDTWCASEFGPWRFADTGVYADVVEPECCDPLARC